MFNKVESLDDLVYVRITDISNLKPNRHNQHTLMFLQENYKYLTKGNPVNYYFNQCGMECAKNMHYIFVLVSIQYTSTYLFKYKEMILIINT